MIEIKDFGIKEYGEVLTLQEELFQNLLEEKRNRKEGKEFILIGEHKPVITLGRRAKESNVLIPEEELRRSGIEIFHIGRGGDVTYHCPGQLIVYPILDLERHNLGVKDYVAMLEETVIRLLQKHDIRGERVEGATGVWIGKGSTQERKISAIGIKCSRFCTMHGLSLNLKADLSGFSLINPCGFQDKGVTSMEKEIGKRDETLGMRNEGSAKGVNFDLDMKEIKKEFLDIFLSLIFPFEKPLYFLK